MPSIPKKEYFERIEKFQANIKAKGLDACLVHGNEADFANVRYLTEYWPTFEAGGVFVPAVGKPVLIIGPESEKYALGRSVIPDIRKMIAYRESAEPQYPGIPVATYKDVVKAAMGSRKLKKLGLVGYSVMTLPVLDALKADLPGVELVKADETLLPLRYIKSKNELACMRKAFEISEIAVEAILNELKVGMTEFQVIGIAQREIYKNGGEYEGHALYCFSGPRTNNAICRPIDKVIKANEIIQLNIGARVGGYSSSVGLPVILGKFKGLQKKLVEFGLKAHFKTVELIAADKPAKDVVIEWENWVRKEGYGDYMLYGPCHAIGMMEVEQPWMESVSKYDLKENMTFQVDTFFSGPDFGLRWENGVRVKKGGAEMLSKKFAKVIEL
ncbi:MAG: putative peptidase [Lentisphaerae bacterium ADurb.Bin242]|nr:MAG: putative peptidase [Lentisphaerae bacterium ADurb.Bin242]